MLLEVLEIAAARGVTWWLQPLTKQDKEGKRGTGSKQGNDFYVRQRNILSEIVPDGKFSWAVAASSHTNIPKFANL